MSDRATHHRWEELPREELGPLIGRRLVTGERLMIAHVYLAEGAIVPQHAHENEQLTYILEGRLRFFLGEDGSEVVDVAAGEVLCIPPSLPHRAEALEDTLDEARLRSLGLEPFRRLMQDSRFAAIPKILETPKGDDDEVSNDRRMLALLRGCIASV